MVGTEAGGNTSTSAPSSSPTRVAGRPARSGRTRPSSSSTYEDESLTSRGRPSAPTPAARPAAGSITRVLASDLDAFSAFLPTSSITRPARPGLRLRDAGPPLPRQGRLQPEHEQQGHVPLHAAGLDHRRARRPTRRRSASATAATNTTAMNFQNSNYQILENIRRASASGTRRSATPWPTPDRRLHEAGREPRCAMRQLFPFVDILDGGHGVHIVRLRAVHAEQRAPLQHVPAPGQLHEVRQQPHADLRRQPPRGTSRRTCSSRARRACTSYNTLADFYTDANGYLANRTGPRRR